MAPKQMLKELAILGGTPAFPEPLHVGRPNIGDRERLMERIAGVLDRRILTNNGPLVQELEAAIAAHLGVRNCITVCNATIGLEIAIRALGMTGEVIVPALTFVATAHALQWQGITPVFCDIDPVTHTLDPRQVEALITPRTTGIIGVHLWGRPCDTDALAAIAARHNLRLLYDAAHAFSCSANGTMIGNFGDVEVVSFHATKFFNSVEGGAILTNNDELARAMRLMINFGFAGFDRVVSIGTNGKMNELSAAMGLTSLESIDTFIGQNRANYHAYRRELSGIPGITQVMYDEAEQANFQYIVLEIDELHTGISRDELVDMLWAEGVVARRYFFPGCHRMEPYASTMPDIAVRLPHTEAVAARLLSLPTGTAVDAATIATIAGLLRLAVAHSAQLRARRDTAALPAALPRRATAALPR